MSKQLKILVSAYACSPHRGSEPGMGWNYVLGLSKYHEVHVISEEKKWKKPVENHLSAHPELRNNLEFYFIRKQRRKLLRKLWPPSYYWYYKDWQKKALQLAKKLDEKENFDLIHQLNMVGFREPGYLWKMDKPFVWGPIGGLENSPWSFLPSLGLKGFVFYTGRNIYNAIQRNFLKRPKKAAKRNHSRLIAATPCNRKWIEKLWGMEAEVISEVGEDPAAGSVNVSKRDNVQEPLKIVWSGLHTPGKNLPLLLEALKKRGFPFELHILGIGEMTEKWKTQAQEYGIQEHCCWYGWMERDKAIEVMKAGHVFVITSISDLTSTVTLEALTYGLPIVCLDHCGFAHVVNEQCGIKVPVENPGQAARDIYQGLKKLAENEVYRKKIANGAKERAQDFSWDKKIDKLNSLYCELLEGIQY